MISFVQTNACLYILPSASDNHGHASLGTQEAAIIMQEQVCLCLLTLFITFALSKCTQ